VPNAFDDPLTEAAPPPRPKAAPRAPARKNAFADLAAPAPSLPEPKPAAPANVVSQGVDAVGGFLNRVGAPRAIDLLDRGRQTTQAAIAGDRPLNTFLHGADQAQQDSDRAVVRKKWGMPSDEERKQLYGARGGLDDFLVDTASDPGTILGAPLLKGALRGGSTVARLAGGLASKAAPELAADAAKVGNRVGDFFRFGGSAKRELGEATFNKAIAGENRQARKAVRADEILKERFEQDIAPLAVEDRRTVYQVLNGERQMNDPASGRLLVPQHVAEAVAKGRALTKDMAAIQATESGLRKIAYGGGKLAANVKRPPVPPREPLSNIEQLLAGAKTPEERKKFLSVMTKEERDAYLKRQAGELLGQSGPEGSRLLQEGGRPIFKPRTGADRKLLGRVDRSHIVPDNLKPFQAPPEQGLLDAARIRSRYLPGAGAAKEVAKDREASSYNLLQPFAPNTLQRESFTVGDRPEDIARLDDAFRGSAKQAARQATAGRLRDELGVPLKPIGNNYEPDALHKLFERPVRAKGSFRSPAQIADEYWRGLVNIPKNTVTTLGLKHGLVNVPALATASEGVGAGAESLLRGAQISRMTPAQEYDHLLPAIEGGVIAPFADRKNPIADAMGRLPGVGRPLGALAHGTNRLTWAIEDAAKAAVYRRKVARGMSPDAAAAETLRETVDYRHRSGFTKAAGRVAPFATFRTRIPAAVASSTVRNPQRIMALDRATSGLFGGGEVGLPQGDDSNPFADAKPKRFSMSNPISDVMGASDNPVRYGRAMLADPLKATATGGADLLIAGLNKEREARGAGPISAQAERVLRYLTYGQQLSPHFDKDGKLKSGFIAGQAAGYIPANVGQAALSGLGVSEYPQQDLMSLLLGGTIGAHIR